MEPDGTLETMPSVSFDAVVVPDGAKAAGALAALGHAREFLRDQYRHCKPILLAGAGVEVAKAAGVPTDDRADWAVVREARVFVGAIGKHRYRDRADGSAAKWRAASPSGRSAISARSRGSKRLGLREAG